MKVCKPVSVNLKCAAHLVHHGYDLVVDIQEAIGEILEGGGDGGSEPYVSFHAIAAEFSERQASGTSRGIVLAHLIVPIDGKLFTSCSQDIHILVDRTVSRAINDLREKLGVVHNHTDTDVLSTAGGCPPCTPAFPLS